MYVNKIRVERRVRREDRPKYDGDMDSLLEENDIEGIEKELEQIADLDDYQVSQDVLSKCFKKAIESDNHELLETLLESGSVIDVKDKYGQTPLFYAAHLNKVEVVKTLIDYNADVDVKNKQGKSALQNTNHPEIQKILQQNMTLPQQSHRVISNELSESNL